MAQHNMASGGATKLGSRSPYTNAVRFSPLSLKIKKQANWHTLGPAKTYILGGTQRIHAIKIWTVTDN